MHANSMTLGAAQKINRDVQLMSTARRCVTCLSKKKKKGLSTSLGPIYSRDLYSYGVLRTIVLVPETPLANKLFAYTRCQPWRPAAWPVPSPVA